VDDEERELWCRAWRLLVEHGDRTLPMIDAELDRALRKGDEAALADWRRVSTAVEELSR
jgi:hypothetical protein